MFAISLLLTSELVDETVTLKTGDILHVGQTDLKIEIMKPNCLFCLKHWPQPLLLVSMISSSFTHLLVSDHVFQEKNVSKPR